MDDLAARFESATAGWRAELAADEWYFARLRERLTGPLTSAEAFASLGGVAALVLRQSDGLLCSEAAQLLLDLARRSDTTEVPPALDREWSRLMRHLEAAAPDTCGQAQELAAWYRRGVAAEPGVAPARSEHNR